MSKLKQFHVVRSPDDHRWAVKMAGNPYKLAVRNNKEEAVKKAIEYAKEHRGELFVHNIDGKIASRNSYGNDPYPPKW